MKSLLDSCNEGLDEHDNSDQSSTHADDEDEAGSVIQVGSSLHALSKDCSVTQDRYVSTLVHHLSSSISRHRWVLLPYSTHLRSCADLPEEHGDAESGNV